MQPLRRGRGGLWLLLPLTTLLLASGCGWKKTMNFPSPSGRNRVEIWQPRLDNSMGLRIELVSSGKRTLLYHSPNDAIVYFAHVCWSNDERTVGILATGTGNWQLAFHTENGQSLPFEQIRDDLRRSIASTYSVPQGLDPVNWAASSEAQIVFFKRHPEIRVSYH